MNRAEVRVVHQGRGYRLHLYREGVFIGEYERSRAVFNQSLQGVSHAMVNEGCKGTARVDLVVELGRGKRRKKRFEIPDVEGKANRR